MSIGFADISGHDREIELLKRAIASGKVAHAYLFAGPDGVGKKKTAVALAAALNCENYTDDSCGECASCVSLKSGSNLNVTLIRPLTTEEREGVEEDGRKSKKKKRSEGTIKIDDVRELQKAIRYRAGSGRVVAIVDGADMMKRDVSNVFLKTLEEPPEGAVIVLVTSRPYMMIPTILSRCQRITFRSLGAELLARLLSEERGISPLTASAAARYGNGSISGALRAIDTGIMDNRRDFVEKFKAAGRDGAHALIAFSEALSKDENMSGYIEFLKCYMRDVVVTAFGQGQLAVNADMESLLKEEAASAGAAALTRRYAMVDAARTRLMPPNYDNAQLTLEALFAGLLDMDRAAAQKAGRS